MKTTDIIKIVGGIALLGGAAYVAYKFLAPGKEDKAKEQGVSLIEVTLLDSSGSRVIRAGQDITATVTFKNIADTPIAPRFRLPIWTKALSWPQSMLPYTPIGDEEGDWQRTPLVQPGDTISFDVVQKVPSNWGAGLAVSVRLDMDGIGAIEQWDHAFDIVAGGEIAELEDVEIEYSIV